MSDKSYFKIINSMRCLESEGLYFSFAAAIYQGTWIGVFATDKPDEINALRKAAEVTSVSEIGLEEFTELCAQSERPNFPVVVGQKTEPYLRKYKITDEDAECELEEEESIDVESEVQRLEDEEKSVDAADQGEKLASVEDALNIGTVETGTTVKEDKKKRGRRSRKPAEDIHAEE